jgi:hypothetical protein
MGRALRIVLLVFEALFLNVIVPGHTRGIIQLPGSKSVVSCCECQCSKEKQTPQKNRAENCAICNFAARVTIPPAIDFAPPPTGLVEILPPPVCEKIQIVPLPPAYLGRAPPIRSV